MHISQWKTKLLITVSYLGVVALFYYFQIPCVFQSLLGICCPGCGMTRALLAVLQLDIRAAFSYHPMFWSLPVLYFYFLFDRGPFPKKRYNQILLAFIGIGFLINWIVNLC